MTDEPGTLHLHDVTWATLRSALEGHELCSILERLANASPDLSLTPLILASYQYGSLLVKDGVFEPPCGLSCRYCADKLERLHYSPIPLGLVLEECVEVFAFDKVLKRSKPYSLLPAGELFGVFEVLDRLTPARAVNPTWSVGAGARSIVILAPFNNKTAILKNIKRTAPDLQKSRAPARAWLEAKENKFTPENWGEKSFAFIRLLADSLGWTWTAKVLLFPQEWVGVPTPQPMHSELHHYLYRVGWPQSILLRQFTAEEQLIRRLWNGAPGAGPFSDADIAYHILRDIVAIGRATAPALAPSTQGLIAGPFDRFQELFAPVFTSIRGKQPSYPVVLQPAYLDAPGRFVYYELRNSKEEGSQTVNVIKPINSALEYIAMIEPKLVENLKLEDRLFFCRSTDNDLAECIVNVDRTSKPLDEEFLPPGVQEGKLYRQAPFLSTCVRLVRK
jgi:hypothetical protein